MRFFQRELRPSSRAGHVFVLSPPWPWLAFPSAINLCPVPSGMPLLLKPPLCLIYWWNPAHSKLSKEQWDWMKCLCSHASAHKSLFSAFCFACTSVSRCHFSPEAMHDKNDNDFFLLTLCFIQIHYRPTTKKKKKAAWIIKKNKNKSRHHIFLTYGWTRNCIHIYHRRILTGRRFFIKIM